MKFPKDDLLLIKPALLVLGASVLAAAILISATQYFASTQHAAREQAQASRNENQQHLAQARNDVEEIRRHLKTYQDLAQKGIVGEEQRLNWVETLVNLGRELNLTNAHYDFSERKRVDLEEGGLGSQALYQSAMRLELPLRHEEELLRFLQTLKQQSRGYPLLHHCELSRIENDNTNSEDPRNIKAVCDFSWLTFRKPDENEAQDQDAGNSN